VWRRFVVNSPARTVVQQVNYTSNQFLSDTMLEVIEEAKEEDFEEYEQCAKVFKCQREIREVMLNDKLARELNKLEVTTVYENEPEIDEDDGELDF